MAGEHEFILSLIGELDEGKTKANVQAALEKVSKNVSLKSNSKATKNAITVFDKEQLKKDGIAYLKSAKDIESQLSQMFKGIGTSFEVNKTFADDGSISKFIAKIYEGTTAIQTLNFEAAKFSDNTVGFRQVGGSAKSGKISTEIQNEIESLKTQNEQLDLQDVLLTRLYQAKQTLNDGSISSDSLKFGKLNEDIRLLENQINSIDFSKISYEGENHLNAVTNATLKAVEAEHKLHNVMMDKKTGVFNIPALEKEGIAFYDNTVGIVERVKQELESKGYQPKIQILSRDTEGQATRFVATFKNASGVLDTINYDLVRLTDGIRTFDGFMSSFGKQVDNTSETNAKAFQKQTKSLAEMELKLRSIRENAFGGTKPLLDEKNVDAVNNKLKYAEGILRGIQSGHDANKIIPIEAYNKFDLVLKEIKQDITVFKDEESLQKSLAGNIESQLNALNTIENKIISIQSKMLDGNKITTPSYISDISNQTANALNTIETLRAKAGSITDTESRNLTNIVATLQREADEYARIDSVQQKSDESLRKQINTLADYKRGLNDIYNLNIDPSSNGALKNQDNINKISESIVRLKSELSSMQQISSSGQLIPVEQMDRYLALYKDLNSQVALARSQEGLDSRIAKDTQSQINKFAEMERALERFRAKYYGDGSSTKLSDQMHIDETVDKLNVLNNMMLIFKSNAGNITDEQINSYKNLENELNITADRYAKLEAIQKKETQTIDDQKYILDGYYLELKKIRETTLNPDSSLSLVNSNEFQKIFDSYSKFEEKYSSLRAINNSGSLINKGDIQETDLIIKELTQDIKILSQAERDREKNKIVQDGFAAQLNLDKERLKTFIQELQRDNLLTKEFRIEIGKLATALYHVKTPEALKNIERDMAALSEQAKRTKNDMQDSISGEQLQQKIRLLSAQVVGYMSQNTKAVGQFKSQFDALRSSINNITDANGLAKAQNEFKLLQQNINNAGQAGMTFGERMSAAVKKFLMWTGMTNVVMYFVRSIKQMITHTKELDSAMTFLKRVTNETDLTYRDMFDNAIKKAKELNSSVKDLINSTAEFAKLGFTSKQAEQLAEATTVYARVGQLDVGDATESIVSTISGFKDLEASDVWKIVDEFDNIGNKFAISSGGIGEALKRSAASLSESNNSLEESIALITTANSVVQDPEKVGTAWRTASLRIRGAKAELAEAGLDAENMVESTAKLRGLVMGIAGVDILEDDAKTFRSTYEIIRDIAKVWNDIDDEVQKSALLEALGGKMQSNILAAVLNNGEMLEDVYKTAGDSLGVAMEEQEKWSKSLEASTGRIGAIFESLSAKIFDNESLKNILESLADILEVIEKIVGEGQGLTMLGGLAGGILGGIGNGFINFKTTPNYWANAVKDIQAFNLIAKDATKTQQQIATAQNDYALSIAGTNSQLSNYLIKQSGATASTGGFIAATIKSTAAMVAKTAAITAFNVAVNGGIMLGISALVTLIGQWINKNKELTEQLANETERLNETTKSLEEYKSKVEEIIDSDEDETKKLEELYEIKKTLKDEYGIEIGKLEDIAEAREKVVDGIEEQIKAERRLYVDNPDNRKAYEVAKKKLNDNSSNGIAKDLGEFWIKGSGGRIANVGDDVESLFDGNHRTRNTGTKVYTIEMNGMDEREFSELLEKKINQFDKIQNNRKLTDDEQKLYDTLYKQYDTLNKKNKDYIKDLEFAKKQAQVLIDMNPNASLSELWEKAGDDRYVKNALEEIIFKTEEITKVEKETVSPLAEVLGNLSNINTAIDDLTTKIKTANEQFDDLDKIIKNNEDTDKFFSASEMIEILEKYPSLSNAIHETTYGYKIEANALEELRAAKLEEQKTALDAELFETNARLNAAKAKILSYKEELTGIKDVADAKVRLAELEAKLESLGENTTNPYYNNGSLETLIGQYKDFIDASESAEKYEKQLEKLDIELQMLGKHHEDASDSKKDETDETNKLKEANKELTDEYKKAKDAIDDLLKLTMDMIKKNKELQKEALKEQLDNFKKLIDKKKELIKLEKDQYDFEKDLKEQNRDLLEIQQELDSLSVEGADYSLEDLKRREELQKQYIEQSEKRDDFLYDHEVETRTKALEDEEETFEDQINTQIKAIEDYLAHEGKIRQDAVDLINGKSQEFYNNLLDYTMNFTDKSRFEFDKLWSDAYAALEKYGNGQIDVDLALAFLIGRLQELENELTQIEKAANDAKHSVSDMAKQGADDLGKLENRLIHVAELISKFGNPPTLKVSDMKSVGSLMNANAAYSEWIKNVTVPKFHDGGIVEGLSTKNGEVLAKLLSGEVVVTQQQTDNFLKKTLPQIATSGVANNQFAPVINMGDIVINGDADNNAINKLKAIQKDITNSVLKAVNNQTSIFNGGRVRTI